MNKGKYVFSQLLDFLDKDVFLEYQTNTMEIGMSSLSPAGISWQS